MRSALAEAPAPDPRAAHGGLGASRRRARSARTARRRRVARKPPRRSTAWTSPCRSSRSEPATRSARRARRSKDADEVLVLSGDTPLLTIDAPRRAARGPPRRGAAATVLSFVPDDIRSYGRIVRDADGDARGDRRGGGRDARAARDPRGELLDLRVPRGCALARDRRADSRERPGRAVPHGRGARNRRGGAARRGARRRRPRGGRGRQHEGRARGRGSGAPRPDQPSTTCSRGSRSSTPRSTWIEPTVTLEPDAVVHPVHRPARRDDGRPPAPRSGRTSVAIDATIGPGALVGTVLLPSPRHRARGLGEGRHVRGAEEHRGRVRAPRCRTSRTWGTRTSARGRTSGPARSPRTSRTTPSGEEPDADRA